MIVIETGVCELVVPSLFLSERHIRASTVHTPGSEHGTSLLPASTTQLHMKYIVRSSKNQNDGKIYFAAKLANECDVATASTSLDHVFVACVKV